MKEIVITSSVLIAVVTLLRLILRKQVSKRLIYATWLLVVLRLLVPIQFGEFEYSIPSLSEKIEQQSSLIQRVQEDFQQPVTGPDQEKRYQQLVQDYLSENEVSGTPVTTVPPEVQTQLRQKAQSSVITPERILTLLWLSGMILSACWFLITNLLFLHKADRDSVPFTDCSCSIPVRISPHVSTPCLAGLFHPRIYLTPESTEDSQKLNHILTHELTHLHHRDHIWVWIRCLCLCIYWFDPMVWLAAVLSKRDCELACDEAALKKLGEDQRIAYGRTLLATVTHTSVRIFHTTTAMSESGKQLRERVNYIVKKPKNLLIAAVCLVLAAALTTGLVFTGCKSRKEPDPPATSQNQPETTEPTTTQPTATEPDTEPTAPYVPAPDILHIIPPLQTEGLTEAYAIVKDALLRYTQYGLEGICCDYELVVADLSQYLTEEQKERYCRQQYKITCCESEEQVREHIDRCLSKDLRWNDYPDDTLFRDGDGNLYSIINPTCYDGYGHIEVISQTKSKIVARACNYDEDGCYRTRVFTLLKKGTGYQLSKDEEDKDYHCETTIVDQGPNYQVLQFGNAYYGYKFYDEDGSLGSHHWTDFRCPIITPITDDLMELAISYGPGHVNRTYFDLKNGGMEAYDYAIAIGSGKIAYLDGDLNNRVLVICDIFDRSNAETFEHLGFAPEPMPVTEAAFSSDGREWTLTLTYRIGEKTEVTWTTSRSIGDKFR